MGFVTNPVYLYFRLGMGKEEVTVWLYITFRIRYCLPLDKADQKKQWTSARIIEDIRLTKLGLARLFFCILYVFLAGSP